MSYIYQKPLSGSKIGVVFGSFAPLHTGHLDLIMKAKKENDGGCIVIVCGYDGDKGEPLIPHSKRYRYVREFFKDDDLVAVYPINDSQLGIARYPNGWEKWLEEFSRIYDVAVNKSENHVKRTWYVGDEEYYDGLRERGEEAVLVDRYAKNKISATKIRTSPLFNWKKIASPFKRAFSTNVLITGTASEGKSTLVQDLGRYFNAPCSYEWARNYMEENCVSDTELDSADFIAFLYGQHDLNRKMINSPSNNGFFFADTDSLVTKMYAEYYAKDPNFKMTMEEFKIIGDLADALTAKSRWDKIFLLCPHGVFVDDHSRYMAHGGEKERKELFDLLCKSLKQHGLWDKVTILDGSYYENYLAVKEWVENFRKEDADKFFKGLSKRE